MTTRRDRRTLNDKSDAPIEGQSHWCDGLVNKEARPKDGVRLCHNIVRNDSDRCAAGHYNRPRPLPVASEGVREDLPAAEKTMGVEDVALHSAPDITQTNEDSQPATQRWRRGKLVEIPEEWRGQVANRQTIHKRISKKPRKLRNAGPYNWRTLVHNRRAHIEGRAPTLQDELDA